ncbi:hypothetical protein MPTK1_4g14350 [Marchantia polymorpha subsp. ruderalis]|uniref:Uncharacterized protein n=2 Tax=Marchantia polymorpha TaxID=3197 RepID=A0AAF6B9T6_MARPO|nr:hypothetical protein MARPO_0070s0047 [Marchantia polymorpha]BBN08769.1 hypothetical protein Mp_4g14350 [Marchantia polymorpha subsp. ruderalis]PTQ35582.1 hypothetical protein MARPO_0070s0047 [Marchantia polymorpha]PTQ35583.1 hypothetical protein MARPO_0070s0047 [Marchantia polymorpha]PTQ35584.1 hypothetical protein MARPO_0070s0047 [Marchantia polymorpha]|eukprot:PTQ35581.1 hypothetical protein MARPO_0070s0047 [Marchantia polymorpha]
MGYNSSMPTCDCRSLTKLLCNEVSMILTTIVVQLLWLVLRPSRSDCAHVGFRIPDNTTFVF